MSHDRRLKAGPNTLYAFWTYDLYPFTLGGVVDEKRKPLKRDCYSGAPDPVYVPAYQGWYRPNVGLVRGYEGVVLLGDLRALEEQHRAAVNSVNADYKLKLQRRLGKLDLKHPKFKDLA